MNEDYPLTLIELEERYNSRDKCLEYLQKLRWPDGFICPHCGTKDAWKTNRGLFHCTECGVQTSLTAGTILHGTRKPLLFWFRALWHITDRKEGTNALVLQRVLNLGSYNTAWKWLHKLRRAMVRFNRGNLSGVVQIDKAYVGIKNPDNLDHGAEGKALVGIAVEKKGRNDFGCIRLKHLENSDSASMAAFVQGVVQTNSKIYTVDCAVYNTLSENGFRNIVMTSNKLKLTQLIAKLMKHWLLTTYQGAVQPSHLSSYLDELTFRLNNPSASHGKLFYLLLKQIMTVDEICDTLN